MRRAGPLRSYATRPSLQSAAAHRRHGEKIRFLVVGLLNTAFSYMLFLVLLWLTSGVLDRAVAAQTALPRNFVDNYYLIAQWGAWVLSIPVNTWALRRFVFAGSGPLLSQVFRAYFVYLPSAFLNTMVLWFAVRILSLPPAVGQVLAIGLTTAFSYLGHKYFTFRTVGTLGS